MIQIIENAKLINGKYCTIVIKDGEIVEITDEDHAWQGKVISLSDDTYVSPGWIDLHTHAFPKHEPYCALPDEIGYQTGVTTVVDAGSSGADDYEEFEQIATKSKTNIYSFLNVSRIGLKVRDELADLSNISFEAIERTIEMDPGRIVGLKARMSQSIVGENDIKPLELAKEISSKLRLPLMVHIGNGPPQLADIIDLLDEGDIITHFFHEKPNNHIFSNNNQNIITLQAAIRRGVYLDIGHGTSSFSFDIARRAKREQIPFHSISTDIYTFNQMKGPVFNMATTLTKFLALGYTLNEVIQSVTENPAKMIDKDELGTLRVGVDANITFFKLVKKDVVLTDSIGNELISPRKIVPCAVYIGGNYYEL